MPETVREKRMAVGFFFKKHTLLWLMKLSGPYGGKDSMYSVNLSARVAI